MWKRFVSRLRSSWLGTWFATKPLRAMVAVSLICIAVALALGKLIPWPFLQNAAADFVGGLLAGLVIFALADAALGLTERREKERHAVQMAYTMLLLEMLDNRTEVVRIVIALKGDSLTLEDPVFLETERVKDDYWKLLAQGPLVENLSPDLFMAINISYRTSRSFVDNLRKSRYALFADTSEVREDLRKRHLTMGESALEFLDSAHDELRSANERMQRS
jgi:hypothetical protein